jgi:hypothetical protein
MFNNTVCGTDDVLYLRMEEQLGSRHGTPDADALCWKKDP